MTHLLNDVTWRCAWRHRWWLRHRGSDWMVVRRRCFVAAEYLLRPERGAEYCSERVCISVCFFSHHDHIFRTTRPIFAIFLCVLLMAVARSSFGGVVIRYVFPFLLMTSYLHISWGCSTSAPGWGSEADTQAWAWRVGIPIAGSGRSGLLLAVRAY